MSQYKFLADWVEDRYFTSRSLLNRLSYRLAGLSEGEARVDPEVVESSLPDQKGIYKEIQAQVLKHFESLLEIDPLHIERPSIGDRDPVYRLAQIATGRILVQGNSAGECGEWIERFVPDLKNTLKRSAQQASNVRAADGRSRKRKQERPHRWR